MSEKEDAIPGKFAEGLFVLSQKAKSKGGDRYKGELRGTDGSSYPLEIYIPQSICRSRLTEPLREMQLCLSSMDMEVERSSNSVQLQLAKAAKSKGGDKFEGPLGEEKITLYLPQQLSRLNESCIREHIVLSFMRAAKEDSIDSGGVMESVAEMKDEEQSAGITTEHISHVRDNNQQDYIASGLFCLHSAAKSKGGDRYKGSLQAEGSVATTEFPLDVYVPQCLSRQTPDKTPLGELTLSLLDSSSAEVLPDSICLQLGKAAKAKGGDKYEGVLLEEKITMYLPQELSRESNTAIPRESVTLVVGYPSTNIKHPQQEQLLLQGQNTNKKRKLDTAEVKAEICGGWNDEGEESRQESTHDRWVREMHHDHD